MPPIYATRLPLDDSATRNAWTKRLTSGSDDRVDPTLHQVVKRPDQNRHNRKVAPTAQQILQEDDLKLDGMFGPMRQLVLEKVAARQRGDPIDIGPIGRHQAQGRLEIFARQRKPPPAILMGHAQDNEGVGVGILDEFFVGPGVNWPPR